MTAICQRCGASKPGPLVPCRTCGHVPVGEERTLAWLLSDHHLSPAELESAARRIRGGEKLAPPEDLLARARLGLQQAIPGRRRRPKPARAEGPQSSKAPSGGTTPGTTGPGGDPNPDTEVSAGEPNQGTRPWAGEPNLRALLALDGAGPPGGVLPNWALWVLGAACVLLTPLPGWIAWWLWRDSAPNAAGQVLRVTAIITAASVLLWLGLLTYAWALRWGLPGP